MFEKISGFFKRFTKRRQKQSGETTIMDAKEEPGVDEFGLGEDFDDFGGLEQPIDEVSTAAGSGDVGAPPYSDEELGLEDDISTGASDYDERTISDEISGDTGLAEEEAEMPAGFLGEEEAASPFEAAEAPPEPVSAAKRMATLAVVAIIGLILGGVVQFFVWPVVGKLVGLSGSDEPKLDIQTQINAAERENARLTNEISEFTKVGGPAEVKALQQQLAQVRDAQGSMSEFESQHKLAKQRETAYDELLKKIDEIESQVVSTSADVEEVKSKIEQARLEVAALAKRTEEEYARFRVEANRAELSNRLLAELHLRDIEKLQLQLAQLQERLSRPARATAPEALQTSASMEETGPGGS